MDYRFITQDKKFAPFFWTQFLGAFNDNFLKNALVVLVAFQGVKLLGMDSGALVAFAGGVFILPFFLFSPLAGQLCDKYEKSQIVRATKILEVAIMVPAALAFLTESYGALLFLLFLMGTQSAFFGPAKYSLIPELVKNQDLTEGNALIELGTFLAILLGTIGGGMAAGLDQAQWIIAIILVAIAALGYFASCKVATASAGDPHLKIQWNPFPEFVSLWKILRERRSVYHGVFAISWFWFVGAGVLSVLPIYVKNYLLGSEAVVTLFLAMFTLGVGMGSILCERLSFKRVEIGLVPIGSLGLTLFLIDIYFVGFPWVIVPTTPVSVSQLLSSISGVRIVVDFLLMSVSGGLFIVPLYTLVQERSRSSNLSRVIAANNILNALFMVVSSVLVMSLYALHLSTVEVFGVFAILNVIVAVGIYIMVPEFTLRFYSWLLSHIIYSVEVVGELHVPRRGPFVLAGNHVTYMDWLIIMGACKRPVSFVMYYKFFKLPVVSWVMKQARVIPIAGRNEDLQIHNNAFIRVSEELRRKSPVCIFPEGQLTLDGELSQFKTGLLQILEKDPVPVVPFVLHGLWNSTFSKNPNKKWQFRRSIKIEFLSAIEPQDVQIKNLQELVRDSICQDLSK